MRAVFIIVGALVGVYLLLVGALFILMVQRPAVFAKGISKVANPVLFMILPFEKLWFVARGGDLEVGAPAPDFNLKTMDRKSTIQLSSFQGQKPVVLVFGSYT